MTAWLLVAGDFTTEGGMDSANHALASYLARSSGDCEVHLVGHRISRELSRLKAVRPHVVPRPFGAERFGEPLLRFKATRWQRRLGGTNVRTIANGGNVNAGDVTWVHYVHAAFDPDLAGTVNRARVVANHRRYLIEEADALRHARLVICNSRRTADDVARLGVPRERTNVVFYGVDTQRFGAVAPQERESARRALGLRPQRRAALFVGALGDRRKAFDTLYEAWRTLCGRPEWDVDLVVAGAGSELPAWRARAARELPEGSVTFLGFRRDMPQVLAACDVLVHPARYEAYGLAVHEALCRGLPAIVTRSAGVAEQYPRELETLLVDDPNSAGEVASRLLAWRGGKAPAACVAELGASLRTRAWDDMAREIEALVLGTRP
jgi:glycosyltransferase involved in cell wall biosynthesis